LKRIDNSKADALESLLSEAGGEPAVVFCRFVADLDRVAEIAGDIGLAYREISGRRKDGLTSTATLTPGTEVCGVQPQSGGVGVELTAAKIGVWYSYPRYLAEYDQAIKRLHRPGTTGVRMYTLIASHTIDEDIQASLSDSREITEGVLARMRARQDQPCRR
jgi:SNF2 family DNA or RNA helicase